MLTYLCRESGFRFRKGRLQTSYRRPLASAKDASSESGNSGSSLSSRMRSHLVARLRLSASRFHSRTAQFALGSPRFKMKKVSSYSQVNSSKMRTKIAFFGPSGQSFEIDCLGRYDCAGVNMVRSKRVDMSIKDTTRIPSTRHTSNIDYTLSLCPLPEEHFFSFLRFLDRRPRHVKRTRS